MFEYNATVVRVLDADTIEFMVDLGFHTHRKEKVRVYDYDAPETRLYKGVTPEEKAHGIEATEYAEGLMPVGTAVQLKTHYDKTGKYGRFLADIVLFGSVDYATHMKEKGFIKNRE